MDKQFRYHEKCVHDLAVDTSLVRLWDVEGAVNGEMIRAAFRPLLATGFVWPYVALMPDYHPGEGSMIGSVIPTRDVLLPSVIGGDLGCGMVAVRLPVHVDQIISELPSIEMVLRANIPVGTAHNPLVTARVEQNPIWQREVRAPILANRLRRKMLRQFASLGGGNHFLEIQRDQAGRVWVMLHSGSRYLGVTMRDYYVEQGKKQEGIDRRLFAKAPYLQARSQLADDYLADLRLVLDFARESRKEMMIRVLEVLSAVFPHTQGMSWQELIGTAYDIAHNYVGEEEHFGERLFVHRKGAICLTKGQVGLIPGSMGTCSYVVEGRGNSFGFNSCSHGAGRLMSRAEAFRVITDKDFTQSMEDVIHAHDPGMKDEAPAAYKDIHRVMRAQRGLVRVLHELNPLLSVKGR
ncbi:MAG: RtcB family protein [Pirellulales bacterium]|nr:RtcB family protein [Pirellulales bacterium]